VNGLLELCPVVRDGETFEIGPAPRGIHDPYVSDGPNPGQRAFHESAAKYRWLCGGLGSGKSTAVAREAFFHSVLRLQGVKHVGLVVSETYRHLADNTVPAFQRAFPPDCLAGGSWDEAFHRQGMILRLWNGSAIAFRVTGNRRYEMLRGPEYAWACFDEGRNIPSAEPWKVIVGRLRGPGVPPQHLRAWGGSTPNGRDWQHATWVESPTPLHAWYHARTAENLKHLPPGYEDELRAVYAEDDARQELDGLFVTRAGAVYPQLREALWPEGNIYPVELDLTAPTWLEVDFGYRNPRVHAVQHHQVVMAGGRVHRLDVIVWEWQDRRGGPPRDRTIHELIGAIEALGLQDLRTVYCDPAGDSANDQTHVTNVGHLRLALKVPVIHPTLTWQRSIATGEQVVRGLVCASDGTRTLVWAAGHNKRGEPVVHPNVANSFRAVQGLQFEQKEPGKPEPEHSLKDGMNDHDTDALRYRAVVVHGLPRGSASLLAGRAA